MITVSISNIKGGVGKSSVASTMAVGLNAKGKKVLMIDADPQSNLTMCFLPELSDEAPSLYSVYKGKGIDEVKVSVKEGLDLLCGDFSLCNSDIEFLNAGRLTMLKKAFKNMKEEYDFVVIDNPPNLGILTLNSFIVSDYVIVPSLADTFSLKGERLLKQALDDVSEEIERKIPVAGILLSRYNSRTNVSKLLEYSLQKAAEMLDTRVFETRIRQGVAIQECQIAKEDLFTYAPKAPITDDYRRFVDEFLERVGVN